GPFNEETVWQEVVPAMGAGEEALNSDYAQECLERIGNPQIEHRLQGIRVDLTAKNSIRIFPSVQDFLSRRNELPHRLLFTLAATLEVVVRGDLEDVHADYICGRWKVLNPASAESLLTFTRESLAYLSARTHEPLDVDRIAPEVSSSLAELREQGLRS